MNLLIIVSEIYYSMIKFASDKLIYSQRVL